DRLDERHRRQRAARLFGEDGGVVQTGTGTAECLGHADADRARLDQVLPEARIESGSLRNAHALGARLGGEQLREGVLQELLFFGETELHRGIPRNSGPGERAPSPEDRLVRGSASRIPRRPRPKTKTGIVPYAVAPGRMSVTARSPTANRRITPETVSRGSLRSRGRRRDRPSDDRVALARLTVAP